MMRDLTELYGFAVFGCRAALLQRVTVGEIRHTYQSAELRHRLAWRAVVRAGLPPFQGAAWQHYDETCRDLRIAETVLDVATEDDTL